MPACAKYIAAASPLLQLYVSRHFTTIYSAIAARGVAMLFVPTLRVTRLCFLRCLHRSLRPKRHAPRCSGWMRCGSETRGDVPLCGQTFEAAKSSGYSRITIFSVNTPLPYFFFYVVRKKKKSRRCMHAELDETSRSVRKLPGSCTTSITNGTHTAATSSKHKL